MNLGSVFVALGLGIVLVFIGGIMMSSDHPRNVGNGLIVAAVAFLPLLYAAIRGVKSKSFRRGSLIGGFGFGTLCLLAAVLTHQSVTRQDGRLLFVTSPGWYAAAKVAMLVGLAAWLYALIVVIAAAVRVWSAKESAQGGTD